MFKYSDIVVHKWMNIYFTYLSHNDYASRDLTNNVEQLIRKKLIMLLNYFQLFLLETGNEAE